MSACFGSGAMTNTIEDIEVANCILIIGSNTFEQHPLIARRIMKAKDKGAKIIVIDPRKTITAKNSDIYLQITPGTNVALINAMIHVIIKEGLIDEEFIKNRTEGFEQLKEIIKRYTPEYASKICGVDKGLIIESAKIYGSAERASIVYCMGVTQFTHGVDAVKALCNLAMITGNIGKEGTGVNPLRGQNNVQGACDMGALPNVFPGYQKVEDSYKLFEEYWKTDLNPNSGLTIPEMIDESGKNIKFLYIMGENPMISDPDVRHVEKALKSLDFLVVQDIFLTETAELADVVLPAACWAEKEGTFTNTERRVQLIRKAINPPGDALEDWIIIKKLAEKLDLEYWVEVGDDPFYLEGRKKEDRGIEFPDVPKYEMRLWLPHIKDERKGVAVTSANVHGTHFVEGFRIKDYKGRKVWTGCTGYGITRWVVGYLAQYGFDFDDWHPIIKKKIKNLPEVPQLITWPKKDE